MKNNINNKGFTLIELLAVLVILTAIMGIAIPTISSSLERNKAKQKAAKEKIIINAAELYVSNYKNTIYGKTNISKCYISLDDLVREDLLSEDSIKELDDKIFYNGNGGVVYNKNDKTFVFQKSVSGMSKCV